jgi:hypothetical protein
MLLDRQVVCSDCQRPLAESENVTPERRTPCETCGSTLRAVQVITAGVIRSIDDLALPFEGDVQLRERENLSQQPDADERLVIVERYIDRDRNIYRERVEDEASGQVLWQVEAALDRHMRTP